MGLTAGCLLEVAMTGPTCWVVTRVIFILLLRCIICKILIHIFVPFYIILTSVIIEFCVIPYTVLS